MHRANPGLLALALLALGFSSAAVEGRIKHSTVHRSMVGRHFRIGVLKGSFPPYWTMTHVEDLVDMQELSVADGGIEGFLVGMVDAVMEELGATYTFVAMDYPSMQLSATDLLPNGTLDMVPGMGMSEGSYIGYNYFGWQIGTNVAATHTMYNTDVSGLVFKTKISPSMWRFLEPFTYELWGVLIASFSAVAIMLFGLQLLNADPDGDEETAFLSDDEKAAKSRLSSSDRWSVVRSLLHSHYHTFAAYLQGDDYEWVSGPERLLRLGLLFLVLISISTYTANLAAFFTAPNVVIHGPKTLSELKTATVCSVSFGDMTGLVDGQLVTLVSWEEKEMAPYVGDIIAPSALDCPDLESLSCGQEFCHQKLVEGEADIWMEDALALNVYQQERSDGCDHLHLVREISLMRTVFNMPMLLPIDSPLLSLLSEAIMFIERQPVSLGLYSKYLKLDRSCSAENAAGDTTQIQLSDMLGLFLFCGVICAVAVVAAVVGRVRRRFAAEAAAPDASHRDQQQVAG